MIKYRVSTSTGAIISLFHCDSQLSALSVCRREAIAAVRSQSYSGTFYYQVYNSMIHDWVSFGQLKGYL